VVDSELKTKDKTASNSFHCQKLGETEASDEYNGSTLLNHCAFSASGKYTCKRKHLATLIIELI